MRAGERAKAIAAHGREHEAKIARRRRAREAAAERKKARGLQAAVMRMVDAVTRGSQ